MGAVQCSGNDITVFIFSVLRLIRSLAKLCTSSKRAWRFCTYSSGDEGVSGGDQTAGQKGDEDLGQKASGMVNIR
ncbi:hypothetical protein TNCV_2393751 [Trichonephila clavipes]|nr:hypothetical protein TNCV_2393751 [Trichonephila clavipes]